MSETSEFEAILSSLKKEKEARGIITDDTALEKPDGEQLKTFFSVSPETPENAAGDTPDEPEPEDIPDEEASAIAPEKPPRKALNPILLVKEFANNTTSSIKSGFSEIKKPALREKKNIFSGIKASVASVFSPEKAFRAQRRLRVSLGNIFVKNPTLARCAILAPIIVAATTVKNAAALSLSAVIICAPAMLVTGIIAKKLPRWAVAAIGICVSALMLRPAYDAVSFISADIFDSLGIYFPLIALSSFSTVFSLRHRSSKRHYVWCVTDTVCAMIGFALAAFAVGAVREILAYGSFAGNPISFIYKIPAAALPFFGFIAAGFLSAFIRWAVKVAKRLKRMRKEKEASENA